MLFTLTYTYFYTSIKVNCQLPVFISIYLFIPEARPEGEADQIVKYSKTLRRKKVTDEDRNMKYISNKKFSLTIFAISNS